jgi:hypothetical protein
MKAEIWFFFTPDGQSEVTVLNRESAQNLAKMMSENLRHLWKVRKNKSNTVSTVADCGELFGAPALDDHEESIFKAQDTFAKDFEMSLAQEAPKELPTPMPVPKKVPRTSASKDNRRYERFDVRLRVVLIAGTRSFRTFSKNISHGGMCFEHVVPKDLLGKDCRVIVGSADLKENLEFDARLAGDPNNPRAIEFKSGRDQFLAKLDCWLKDLKQAA